jgi:hypothetical protein
MTWYKPNTPVKWIALFAPPATCVVTTVAGDIFNRENDSWIFWAFAGFLMATIISLFISGWLTRRNTSLGAQFACCIGLVVFYVVVDCAILFAALSIGSRLFPQSE